MSMHGLANSVVAGSVASLAAGMTIRGCQFSGRSVAVPPEQQARLEALQAKGTQASITVFPVVMGEDAFEDVADVVALLLEQGGMSNLQTTGRRFKPPRGSSLEEAGERFGSFVRASSLGTEYALYGEFVGSPESGPQEIRGIIVDRAGHSVWVDRQTAGDRAFKRARPHAPMTCCQFLAERVRTGLGIPRSVRDHSGQGRFARRFAEDSPAPAKEEWETMDRRRAEMKRAGRSATVSVFPVRLGNHRMGHGEAVYLAELLTARRLCAAEPVDVPLRLSLEPSRNEQDLLWGLANKFRDHVRRNPPRADYALLADYIMNPRTGAAWAVHFVVCDRRGEWVIVDFQNEHHGDFRRIAPQTQDDCGRLVAHRLEGYLR